jgi:glycerol uptake facilitator-like aquaporin
MNNAVQGPIAGATGMFFGQMCSTKISGGHLNPAVTIALAWHEKFHWGKCIFYIIAQVAGAFCASIIVFLNYAKAFEHYAGGQLLTPPAEQSTA